jgi:two-component system, cell cycle sensor histidine kinase and response regulator CckA
MINTYRILIVDDDSAQAEMVSEFLHIAGYQQVDYAATIQSAWRHLSERTYDVILLDYRLPDGTGLELLDQLARRGQQIPVVMVTGQGNERVAVQAIQHGAADYLLKSGDYIITLPALIHKTVQANQLKLSIQRTQEQIRYQATLLNNVRDAIVVWDLTGRITFWNPSAEALFDCSAEERLGQPVASVYLSIFKPPVALPKKDETGVPHVVRQLQGRDGKTIWVSSRVSALHDDAQSERPLGYMDVSHDITRSIEAERALRESEARYRAIVEDYQTELICRFRPNGMLTFANAVYCDYFNKSREELLGMNFLYFIPENERSKLIQHLSGFGPGKPVGTLEHQIDLPGQGLRWLQRTDRAIFDDRGRIFEFQSVGRDITDRKRLESQIQAAQAQLVHAARMATIGEVASGVAHQIYNPLTTIIADAQILLRQLSAKQPGRESAEAIEQAGWRLQNVVQRLMEFSRPATETLSSLTLNETIQSALSLVHASIESIGGQLEAQLSDDLPRIRGNAQQLENLWVNLLLLARDAVAVQVTNADIPTIRVISRTETPEEVIVEIWDNGRPIPTEHLDTIFEPNFIGPTSGRGTGMELSICREIVRQHSGQIKARTTDGHDTIIFVLLPAED